MTQANLHTRTFLLPLEATRVRQVFTVSIFRRAKSLARFIERYNKNTCIQETIIRIASFQ